ncbi:diphthine--ammonia ligase [Chloroflexota bacterium]
MSYILSWSGGKDCCFAGYEAMRQGYKISHLMNFISDKFHKVRAHDIGVNIIQLQSQAVGIPLVQKETTWDGYEQNWKEVVKNLISGGIEGVIFGDIYVQPHKDWVERVCGELNIEAIEPLWMKNTEEVLSGFINAGFQAVVVSAKTELIDKDWIGHSVDGDFISYLRERKIDVCGENGEYHTLVIDGPIFREKIQLVKGETVARGNYWSLDASDG